MLGQIVLGLCHRINLTNRTNTLKIGIFGTHDSLAGQIYNLSLELGHEPVCFIGEASKAIDIKRETEARPNKKMEFPSEGTFYKLPVITEKEFFSGGSFSNLDGVAIAEYNGESRQKILDQLRSINIKAVTLVHPSAYLAGLNDIDEGAIIFPKVYVGYKTDIGKCCILQTMACIEHHSRISDYCDVNPAVAIAGSVLIGKYCEINMGVTIINRIRVSERCRVGAGSLVLSDCDIPGLYYGRPAKLIKPLSAPEHQ